MPIETTNVVLVAATRNYLPEARQFVRDIIAKSGDTAATSGDMATTSVTRRTESLLAPIPWTISTKYYTAQVEFRFHDLFKPYHSDPYALSDALIYWFGDHIELARNNMDKKNRIRMADEAETLLSVGKMPASYNEEMEERCLLNGFEWINVGSDYGLQPKSIATKKKRSSKKRRDAEKKRNADKNDAGEGKENASEGKENAGEGKEGLERVIEALQANTWHGAKFTDACDDKFVNSNHDTCQCKRCGCNESDAIVDDDLEPPEFARIQARMRKSVAGQMILDQLQEVGRKLSVKEEAALRKNVFEGIARDEEARVKDDVKTPPFLNQQQPEDDEDDEEDYDEDDEEDYEEEEEDTDFPIPTGKECSLDDNVEEMFLMMSQLRVARDKRMAEREAYAGTTALAASVAEE